MRSHAEPCGLLDHTCGALRRYGAPFVVCHNVISCGLRRLRDLNDEINKLIREKGHWERRIVELGGPDYAKSAPKVNNLSRTSRLLCTAPLSQLSELRMPI